MHDNGANLKKKYDETSKCSYFSSTGSIVANSKIKIIPIGPGNVVGPLETRSGAIRGPYFFFLTEAKYQLWGDEICEADHLPTMAFSSCKSSNSFITKSVN